jgi:hypothetical protein
MPPSLAPPRRPSAGNRSPSSHPPPLAVVAEVGDSGSVVRRSPSTAPNPPHRHPQTPFLLPSASPSQPASVLTSTARTLAAANRLMTKFPSRHWRDHSSPLNSYIHNYLSINIMKIFLTGASSRCRLLSIIAKHASAPGDCIKHAWYFAEIAHSRYSPILHVRGDVRSP